MESMNTYVWVLLHRSVSCMYMLFIWVHAFVCDVYDVYACDSQKLPPWWFSSIISRYILGQGHSLNMEFTEPDCLGSKLSGSNCLCSHLSLPGGTDVHCCCPWLLYMGIGIKLRSPCLWAHVFPTRPSLQPLATQIKTRGTLWTTQSCS